MHPVSQSLMDRLSNNRIDWLLFLWSITLNYYFIQWVIVLLDASSVSTIAFYFTKLKRRDCVTCQDLLCISALYIFNTYRVTWKWNLQVYPSQIYQWRRKLRKQVKKLTEKIRFSRWLVEKYRFKKLVNSVFGR